MPATPGAVAYGYYWSEVTPAPHLKPADILDVRQTTRAQLLEMVFANAEMIRAAPELEMQVVPEGGSLYCANVTQILDGHTTVEHNLPPPVLYKDILTVFAKSQVGYTPTLIVSYVLRVCGERVGVNALHPAGGQSGPATSDDDRRHYHTVDGLSHGSGVRGHVRQR